VGEGGVGGTGGREGGGGGAGVATELARESVRILHFVRSAGRVFDCAFMCV